MVTSFRAMSQAVLLPTSAIITTRLIPQILSTGALLAVAGAILARLMASLALDTVFCAFGMRYANVGSRLSWSKNELLDGKLL